MRKLNTWYDIPNTRQQSYNNIRSVNFVVRGLWHFVMPKFNMYYDAKDPFDHSIGFKQVMTHESGNVYLLCKSIIMIEPLKVWHNIINLEFIIYLVIFSLHFYLSLFHVLYFMSVQFCISYIIHDLVH